MNDAAPVPVPDLAALAEAMVLQRFTALEAVNGPASFDPLFQWLSEAETPGHPGEPFRELTEAFDLSVPVTSLIALLVASATSEAVARKVAETGTMLGGLPVWLALKLIPGLGMGALAAGGALRRFLIVELSEEPRVLARLTLAESVLDRLLGQTLRDPEVAAVMSPAGSLAAATAEGVPALRAILASRGPDGLPPVVLAGTLPPGRIAAALAALGLRPWRLVAEELPDDAYARDRLARIWSREAALGAGALIVDANGGPVPGLVSFCDGIAGHVVISGAMPADRFTRVVAALPPMPRRPSETAGWSAALGPIRAKKVGTRGLARVANQFCLSDGDIRAIAAQAGADIAAADGVEAAAACLWHHAARAHQPAPIPGMALNEPVFDWDDIVLPATITAELKSIAAHVYHAAEVLDDWGFDRAMGGRGRGVAVLFSGPSGTGKTMAAEVLASALDLRMMVIDLSQIISKYVGETSKNIAAAFAEAERTGAVMVWNEGDAVWGARGQVGTATDRHINAETGDLLSRIESFTGFTVVTTNLRDAIDPAFRRRFRFVVEFPLPSAVERLTIWRKAFPAAAPKSEINWHALAELPLSGGAIRNVALKSAFSAADAGRPIDEELIESELAAELAKDGRPAPAIDWGLGR